VKGYDPKNNKYYLGWITSEAHAMGAVIHKPGITAAEVMDVIDTEFAESTIKRALRSLCFLRLMRAEFKKVEGKPYKANHYYPIDGGSKAAGVHMPKKDWQRRDCRYWFAVVNKHGSIVKTMRVKSILESDMLEEAKRKDKSYPKSAPHYVIRIVESGTPVPEEAAA